MRIFCRSCCIFCEFTYPDSWSYDIERSFTFIVLPVVASLATSFKAEFPQLKIFWICIKFGNLSNFKARHVKSQLSLAKLKWLYTKRFWINVKTTVFKTILIGLNPYWSNETKKKNKVRHNLFKNCFSKQIYTKSYKHWPLFSGRTFLCAP